MCIFRWSKTYVLAIPLSQSTDFETCGIKKKGLENGTTTTKESIQIPKDQTLYVSRVPFHRAVSHSGNVLDFYSER